MNINELTIGQAKELAAMFGGATERQSCMLGEHCVVRTYSAGVWIGVVVEHVGTEVVLKDAMRLWKWSGAFTLSEVATKGIAEGSRIATPVPKMLVTQAVEIIPTTEVARETYKKFIE